MESEVKIENGKIVLSEIPNLGNIVVANQKLCQEGKSP